MNVFRAVTIAASSTAVALATIFGGARAATPGDRHQAASASARYTQVAVTGFPDNIDACALRTDGSIVCTQGEASTVPPPPGHDFVQVTLNTEYGPNVCALRSTGTVACTGNYNSTERYKEISLNGFAYCGVSLKDNLACDAYGLESEFPPPAGRFKQVSLGGVPDYAVPNRAYFGCAIRLSGAVACWGVEPNPQSPTLYAPKGRFLRVSAGVSTTCGLRTDHTITCWGEGGPISDSAIGPASYRYTQVGGDCGLRRNHTVQCGPIGSSGGNPFPGMRFRQFAQNGSGQVCGIELDGELEGCTPPPAPDRYTQVATDEYSNGEGGCALRIDGSVDCFTGRISSYPVPPEHDFVQISVNGDDSDDVDAGEACGLERSSRVTCWPAPGMTPRGKYRQISVGLYSVCGVTLSRRLKCRNGSLSSAFAPPKGKFKQVSVGGGVDDLVPSSMYFACAVRLSRKLACWGANPHKYGPARVYTMKGRFLQVSAGFDIICGLRTDHTVTCSGPDGPSFDPGIGPKNYRYTQVNGDCGLRRDGHIQCADYVPGNVWPHLRFKQFEQFGWGQVCGIELDGSLTCDNPQP